jgi:hypothetical protein
VSHSSGEGMILVLNLNTNQIHDYLRFPFSFLFQDNVIIIMQGYLQPADGKQCPCRPTKRAIYSGFPASICTLRKPYLQRILYISSGGKAESMIICI